MRPGPLLAAVVGVVTSDLGSGPSQVSQCYPGGKRGILRADPTCHLDQNSRFIVSPFLALLCPRKVPIVSWTRVPLGLKGPIRPVRRWRVISTDPGVFPEIRRIERLSTIFQFSRFSARANE